MKKIPNSPKLPKPVSAYSTAIISNSMLYVSGQIGMDPNTGKLSEGGVEVELKQILINLDLVLESAEIDRDAVVMVTIFLAKMSDFQKLNSIYAQWVNSELPPARQTVAVKELPLGASVEISLIAEIV